MLGTCQMTFCIFLWVRTSRRMLVVSAFAWSIKACGANTMIPSDGADLRMRPICQPVLSSPWLISRWLLKEIRVFSSFSVLFILFLFLLFYSCLFCLAERIAEIIAERNYLNAMTRLRISFLYCFFMPSGRKEASIRSSHFTIERRNFLAMLLITFR